MNEWMKPQWIERVPTLRSRWMGGLIFGGFWPLCRHHINFQGIWLIFYSQLMGQWYASNMQIRCKVAKNQKKKKKCSIVATCQRVGWRSLDVELLPPPLKFKFEFNSSVELSSFVWIVPQLRYVWLNRFIISGFYSIAMRCYWDSTNILLQFDWNAETLL